MKVEATPEQDAMVQAFARAIEQAGGKALLVGGLVRDEILGLPSKDFDFEVFGLPMEKVQEVLSRFGNVKEVGQQFGVLNIQELDWDVALPRREQKTGEGHKGFDVVPDPTMSIEEAARRRDLTINALSKDPLTGEIIDPLNGMADIKAGILRMADPHTFGDDPLRALRVAQFAARFDFEVDPETLKVVAAQPLEQLPGERILPEFSKMLLKGQKPSKGIEVLRSANLLRYFPEIEALQGVPQEPKWHPEGDVYVHTLMVLDEAGKQRTGDPDFDLPLMLGALAHDFGKPISTEEIDGKIVSRGHEQSGIEPTRAFLGRMKAPLALTKQVETLVDTHLRPAILPGTSRHAGSGRKGYRKLGRTLQDANVSPELLAALSKADVLGRTTEAAMRRDVSSQDKFLEDYRQHVTSVEDGGKLVDSVSGKHLISKGFKPGPDMGKFLALTRSIEDETGITDPDKLIDLATRFLSDRPEGGGSQEGNPNDCGDSHIREGEECFDGDYRAERKKGNTKSTLATELDWTIGRPCGDEESYPDKCGPGGSPAFSPPDFGEEYEEALRYPHLAGKTPEEWNQIAQTGQSVKWSELEKAGPIGNHDEPGDFGALDEDKKGRFHQSMESGQMEMPIIIRTPDGGLDLLGGNTRQAGLRAAGVDPDVWFVDTSQITAEFFDWTIGRPCEDGPEEYPEKCTGPGSSAENPSGPHDETGLEEIRRLAEEKVKRKAVPPNPKQKAADQIMLDRLKEQKAGEKAAEKAVRQQDAADLKMLTKEEKAKDKRDKATDKAGQDLEKTGDKALLDAKKLQEREAAKKAKDLAQRQKISDREAQKRQKEWMKNESPQALKLQKEKQDAADLKMLTKEENKVAKEAEKAKKLAEKEQALHLKQQQQAEKLAEKEKAQKIKQAEQEYKKYVEQGPKSQVPQGMDFQKWLEYIFMGPDEEKAKSTMGPSAFRTHPDKSQPDFLLWEQFDIPVNQKGKALHPGLASVSLGEPRPCYPQEDPVEDHCNDNVAPPTSGGSLTEHDTLLLHDQARLQHSDSPEEIKGLTDAWNEAKAVVHSNPEILNDPHQAEAFALGLAAKIDPNNSKGYRQVAVTFGPGKPPALSPELVPRAMEGLFGAYADQVMEPDEWYHEFEKVHPLEDGNGRLGDLLWKMDHVRRGQPWPNTHPPDFFGTDKSDYTAAVTAEPQRIHERTNKYPGVKDFDRGSRFSVHPLEGPLGRDGFGGTTPTPMDELDPRQNGMTPETGIFPDWEGDPAQAYETPNDKDRGFLPVELPLPLMPETSTPHPSPTRAEPAPPSSFPGQVVRKPGGGGLDRAPMMRPNGKPSGVGFLPVQSPPEPENMFEADLLPGGKGDDMPDSEFDKRVLKRGTEDEMDEHGVNYDMAKEITKDHLAEDPDAYVESFDPTNVHGPGGNNPGGTLNDQGRGGRGGGTKRRDYWDMDYTGKKSGFQSIGPPKENIYPAATEAARTMEDLMDIEVIHPHDYNPDWKGGGVSMPPHIKHQNTRKTHDLGLDPFPKGIGPDGEVIEGDDDANIEQKQVQPLIPNQKMAIAVDPKGPFGERIVIMSPLFEEVSPAIMALRSHRFERHGGIVIDGPPEWLLGITPRLEALDKSSEHDGADDLFARVQQLIQSAGMPIEYEQQPQP